jgi:hypothetical protein
MGEGEEEKEVLRGKLKNEGVRGGWGRERG